MANEHEEMLKKAIKKHEKQEAAEERKIQIEEQNHSKKVNDFQKREKELYPEKLLIAEEIMKWVKEFDKKFDFKEVIISYGGWGHKLPRYGGGGCWSQMHFQRPNRLEYEARYKWINSALRITFDNKKKLAEKLSYNYLKSLQQEIVSGKVYKTIERELE